MYKITRILLYCCTVIKGTFTSFLKHGLLPTVRNWRYNRVWRSDRVWRKEKTVQQMAASSAAKSPDTTNIGKVRTPVL